MSFVVPPEDYARFMGRYAEPLATVFARFAGVGAGDKVLDVGCGTGALTAHLLSIGADVTAIDPSPPFIEALAKRLPDVEARLGTAEELPYSAATFDAAVAQLVVHFMPDPVAGLRQMARVTRPGGVVAACVWDGATGALAPFWDAVRVIDPDAQGEAFLSGASEGHLTEIFEGAGLRDSNTSPTPSWAGCQRHNGSDGHAHPPTVGSLYANDSSSPRPDCWPAAPTSADHPATTRARRSSSS
ncbi:class I SAM-dependent methyltransferase [Mycobacterium sp. CVI_P3]|uniref:Class I SAM-dependent methyltransferase n=1 Tax=Mycobacterium pinniadriaticum TaxID=2994102 RepID=A0ABT3SHQ8_9MYCO|nr:class I SAM-dependent methyltransferase [Mycobacterium pinniadriaticum]MCX2932459.1 class I SAM-dependent methyltransferase [Mycobacterium pinniadriaticum]MCX2938907.1 class I SAM-dependent methyltransferase [Mycobacterium pinniadriaticum]